MLKNPGELCATKGESRVCMEKLPNIHEMKPFFAARYFHP
jgi:hypothetical protein